MIEDEKVDISVGSGSVSDAYLMAINTKEFGQTAKLQRDKMTILMINIGSIT